MTTQLKPRPSYRQTEEQQSPETEARRRMNRWVGAIAAMALVAAGLIVVSVLSADPASNAATVPVFDSPGGNSVNVPTQPPTASFDGPGGNSLNIPTNQTDSQTPAFDGPGGNSLNIPTGNQIPAFDGPGGNSLILP